MLMLSLTGPGNTSDFREGSNREFEKSKRGDPSLRFWRCAPRPTSLIARLSGYRQRR